MAKMKSGYDKEMSYIPMDLITEHILTRLPVKHLCRFKSVCKNWLSLISSPSFAKSHLKTYSSPLHFIVLTDYVPLDPSNRHVLRLLSYDEDNPNSNNLMNCVSLDFEHSSECIWFLGSFNGIVCLCMWNDLSIGAVRYKFVVWNPVTGERCEIDFPDEFLVTAYGFTYESLVDDYKIVVHTLTIVDGAMTCKCFHVFSLRDRKWKKILHDAPFHGQHDKPAVVVNGELYWIRNGIDCDHIFKFNLASEAFEKKPHIKGTNMILRIDLFQIKGCLGLRSSEEEEGISEIWLMKNADDWNSWQKLFSIRFQGHVYFSGIGKCVVQCDEDEYHLVDLTQEALKAAMFGNRLSDFRAKELVESLVSPLALLGLSKNEAEFGRLTVEQNRGENTH